MITLQAASASSRASTIAATMTKRNCWAAALALPLVAGPIWCLIWSSQNHWLGTLAGLVLLAVLGTCTVTDLQSHRIYNWATYSAFLWAMLINIVATAWPSAGEMIASVSSGTATVGPKILGGVGIDQSLGGAALCFVITLAGYHMSGRGAGDVNWRLPLVHCWEFIMAFLPWPIAISLLRWR